MAVGAGEETAVSTDDVGNGRFSTARPVVATGGKRPAFGSGKKKNRSSGKVVANPEVAPTFATNEKSTLPPINEILPLTPDDDFEVSFEDDVGDEESGWRLEKNSNGFYRWRWQLKQPDGSPVTYVNQSGKIGYRRGSKYVGKKED